MTFQEWVKQNQEHVSKLTPSDLTLVELGWMAARADSNDALLAAMLQREAA